MDSSSHGWNPEEVTNASDGLPDKAIVPYVEALNDAGVETYQSCSGHVIDVDDAGNRFVENGHLWFESDAFDPDTAVATGAFDHVARVYGREAFPVWEVYFPGLARGEDQLREAMGALFGNLGVKLP